MSAQYDDDDLIDSLEDEHDDGEQTSTETETSADSEKEGLLDQPAEKPKVTRFDKRINELTWKAKTAEEKAAAAEARAEAAEAAAAELAKTSTTERIAVLKNARIDALKAGDHELLNEIDDRLMDLKLVEKTQTVRKPVERVEPQEPEKTAAQIAYESKNSDWIGKDKERIEKANRIIERLVSEKGIAPKDPILWELLDRNINRQKQPSGERSAGTSTETRSGSGLTRDDMNMMKEWGLDPTNKAHQDNWLQSKQKVGQ